MILDLIQIFRARRDTALASKLALRLAQGQLLDRATAPLLTVHLCLWAVMVVTFALFALLLIAAIKTHWSLGVFAVVPLAISFSSGWVSSRLKKSLDHIRTIAANYSDAGIDSMIHRVSATHSSNSRDFQNEISDSNSI